MTLCQVDNSWHKRANGKSVKSIFMFFLPALSPTGAPSVRQNRWAVGIKSCHLSSLFSSLDYYSNKCLSHKKRKLIKMEKIQKNSNDLLLEEMHKLICDLLLILNKYRHSIAIINKSNSKFDHFIFQQFIRNTEKKIYKRLHEIYVKARESQKTDNN